MSDEQSTRARRNRMLVLAGLAILLPAGWFGGRAGLAKYRLWRGQQALLRWQPSEAVDWLQAAERLNKNDSRIPYLMARAYRQLGELDRMQACLARSRQLGHPADQLNRQMLLLRVQMGLVTRDDPQLRALLNDPGDHPQEVYDAVVEGAMETKELGLAQMLLDAWHKDFPDDAQRYFWQGQLEIDRGKTDQAIAAFQRALQLQPWRRDIRLRLAATLADQDNYPAAADQYVRCMSGDTLPEALAGAGYCLLQMGKLDKARQVYQQLLEGWPEDYDGQYGMGELQLASGQWQEAVRWLTRAVQQKPYMPRARSALAMALLYSGHPEEAQKHFRFASQALIARDRIEKLKRRLAQDTNDVRCRYELGRALLQYGNPRYGVFWLQTVLKLQPHHRQAHLALADYFAREGNAALAARHRRLANAPTAGPASGN